jgi:Lysozyme like domain
MYSALVRAGVPSNDAGTLTQISGAESGYGANVISGANTNGTIDYGVFQINSGAWPQYGGSAVLNMSLDDQAAAAANIYNQQGLTAWSTYNSGAYQGYSTGTGAGSTIANGPVDTSSGLGAGINGTLSADPSTPSYGDITGYQIAGVNAPASTDGSTPGSSPGAGAGAGAQGSPIQVALQPEATSAIQGWVNSFETSVGTAFANALKDALATVGIDFGAMQNWFVRAGVILLGILLIVVGLIGLFWEQGGKQIAQQVTPKFAA